MTSWVDPSELRAAFALGLSEMYAAEVPLYRTLLDTCALTNAAHAAGSLDSETRVGTERHGAIRLGSMTELAQIARLFSLFGMRAVGIYDLRDTTTSSLPIVATAFRPISTGELERSAFRMFTSVLVPSDRRFFDADTAAEIERRVAARTLLSQALVQMIERCESLGGVPPEDADRFVDLSVDALRLDGAPLDLEWNHRLADVSPVAADIAGAPSTHLNHLTPRVFDIDATYACLAADGVEMIERIQGPPKWQGPPILLRQTSFRALDETRRTIDASGRPGEESVRVRFGEVEQRGVALTRSGRALVDRLLAAETPLESELPTDLAELARMGVAHVRFASVDGRPLAGDVWDAVAAGHVAVEGVTYEDFLPASATGIFESNLAHAGARIEAERTGTDTALTELVAALGSVFDPHDLAAGVQEMSLASVTGSR
ncbi:MAG: DUF1338 family protein [Ilumatobacter sp.]